MGFEPAPPLDELLPDVPLPVVPPPEVPPDVPLVAAVGTACAVQVNDWVAVLPPLVVETVCVHMTMRFRVVSIYHVDTGVTVLLVVVVPVPPLLLGISGI
jgi:hypothetical protein